MVYQLAADRCGILVRAVHLGKATQARACWEAVLDRLHRCGRHDLPAGALVGKLARYGLLLKRPGQRKTQEQQKQRPYGGNPNPAQRSHRRAPVNKDGSRGRNQQQAVAGQRSDGDHSDRQKQAGRDGERECAGLLCLASPPHSSCRNVSGKGQRTEEESREMVGIGEHPDRTAGIGDRIWPQRHRPRKELRDSMAHHEQRDDQDSPHQQLTTLISRPQHKQERSGGREQPHHGCQSALGHQRVRQRLIRQPDEA